MLPFEVQFRAGESPYRQIVYAATKAVLAGDLRPGDAFPSVRELSQALKINPNTAQKVVAELTRDGLLEVRPGIGTVVVRPDVRAADERRELIAHDLEQVVVQARRLGMTRAELSRALTEQWDAIFADAGARRGSHA